MLVLGQPLQRGGDGLGDGVDWIGDAVQVIGQPVEEVVCGVDGGRDQQRIGTGKVRGTRSVG